MSADIEKLAVFDDRIVQSRPKYAVEKGALSVTNAPFQAIAVNTSQHTYNILVPSENIFIDRAVDWTSRCFLQVDVTLNAELNADEPIFVPGRDFALCAFPLQSLTNTMTATINDTTVTINSADVLPQVLRMTDYKYNRLIRTCPTMLDKYKNYSDAAFNVNNPLSSYGNATATDEVPNGAYWNLYFTSSAGTQLAAGDVSAGGGSFEPWTADANGLPCANGTVPAGTQYRLWLSFQSTEKLVLSPFVFSDSHEWDCGLFGCQNIQLVMNMQNPGRVLRSVSAVAPGSTYGGDKSTSSINYGSVVYNPNTQGFNNAVVNLQFLTPSLDISLPPKSVVPYMEFPRYITSGQVATKSTTTQLQSQTIVLPMIPDLLLIWCRPQQYTPGNSLSVSTPDPSQGDWLLPITNISVNFDNFAGLLSAHTQPQLYKMSVNNGLEVDYNQWVGKAWGGPAGGAVPVNSKIPLSGGMLVLKPGRDIVLQAGQASGLVGNFVLQFQLTVENTSAADVPCQIFVVTANSGFFETIKGSSRVIKGVLTEQDIISAPVAPAGTHGQVRRMVGAGVTSKLGNAVSAIKDLYHQSKPYISAAKNCLAATGNSTAGKVAGALGAVGYGRRGHSDLSDRLM